MESSKQIIEILPKLGKLQFGEFLFKLIGQGSIRNEMQEHRKEIKTLNPKLYKTGEASLSEEEIKRDFRRYTVENRNAVYVNILRELLDRTLTRISTYFSDVALDNKQYDFVYFNMLNEIESKELCAVIRRFAENETLNAKELEKLKILTYLFEEISEKDNNELVDYIDKLVYLENGKDKAKKKYQEKLDKKDDELTKLNKLISEKEDIINNSVRKREFEKLTNQLHQLESVNEKLKRDNESRTAIINGYVDRIEYLESSQQKMRVSFKAEIDNYENKIKTLESAKKQANDQWINEAILKENETLVNIKNETEASKVLLTDLNNEIDRSKTQLADLEKQIEDLSERNSDSKNINDMRNISTLPFSINESTDRLKYITKIFDFKDDSKKTKEVNKIDILENKLNSNLKYNGISCPKILASTILSAKLENKIIVLIGNRSKNIVKSLALSIDGGRVTEVILQSDFVDLNSLLQCMSNIDSKVIVLSNTFLNISDDLQKVLIEYFPDKLLIFVTNQHDINTLYSTLSIQDYLFIDSNFIVDVDCCEDNSEQSIWTEKFPTEDCDSIMDTFCLDECSLLDNEFPTQVKLPIYECLNIIDEQYDLYSIINAMCFIDSSRRDELEESLSNER